MDKDAILCSRCAHPYALDYRRSRAGPPAHIHGKVAGSTMSCTRCSDEIPEGRGYVIIERPDHADELDRSTTRRPTTRSNLSVDVVTTILGLALAIAPLALWVAPTIRVFVTVLSVTTLAFAGLCLLDVIRGERSLITRMRRFPRVRGLPDRFIAELLNLLPLTHHNRRPGDPVFQRKMEKLKSFLDD